MLCEKLGVSCVRANVRPSMASTRVVLVIPSSRHAAFACAGFGERGHVRALESLADAHFGTLISKPSAQCAWSQSSRFRKSEAAKRIRFSDLEFRVVSRNATIFLSRPECAGRSGRGCP